MCGPARLAVFDISKDAPVKKLFFIYTWQNVAKVLWKMPVFEGTQFLAIVFEKMRDFVWKQIEIALPNVNHSIPLSSSVPLRERQL